MSSPGARVATRGTHGLSGANGPQSGIGQDLALYCSSMTAPPENSTAQSPVVTTVPAGENPPRRRIMFWEECDDEDERTKQRNRKSAEERHFTLFGGGRVSDPLEEISWEFDSDAVTSSNGNGFKLVPSEFLARARRNRPHDPQPTASAFSAWLYSLYGEGRGTEEQRERGKEVEQSVLEWRQRTACCTDNKFLRRAGSDWVLIHNGIGQLSRYIEIDHLRVRGKRLRVSPDLMYFNATLAQVMIVEIKHTRMAVPPNLWPNVWGQLWCYSQIERALGARSVTVVGEVWGDLWQRRERTLCLRASVHRNPRKSSFDRFFRELFTIYSGSPVPFMRG